MLRIHQLTLVVTALVVAVVTAHASPALAQRAPIIVYDGTLDESDAPADGSFAMEVELFDGDVSIYDSELVLVTVTQGRFTLLIGEAPGPSLPDAVHDALDLQLALTVEEQLLAPRQRLFPAATAVQADRALLAEGALLADRAVLAEGAVDFVASGLVTLTNPNDSGPLRVEGPANGDRFAVFGTLDGASAVFGYAGSSFGNGTLFVNARADASSVAPNPSVRVLTATVERMIVTNAGSVGIGTSAPASKLHVNGGDIRVSSGSFIDDGVTLNVPDWVFTPANRTKLRPLSAVDAYITKEQHLPDVPSAADIKRSGVDIAKMQMTLLQKIEELTLYAIEQDKRIQTLEAKQCAPSTRRVAR